MAAIWEPWMQHYINLDRDTFQTVEDDTVKHQASSLPKTIA